MKSILISGGTGFIGKHLIGELQARGYGCHILSRQSKAAVQTLLGPTINVWSDVSQIPKTTYFTGVVNLAGAPIVEKRWSAAQKKLLQESRITTTQNLVDWMKNSSQPPEVFVSGSAIGFYGNQENNKCSEDSPPVMGFTHSLCQKWEDTAKAADSLGVRTCLLRTGVVLSAEGGMLAKLAPAFRFGLGGKIGSGQQWISWIHMSDMTRVILHLLTQSDISGPVNATSPYPVTNLDFTRHLARVFNKPAILPVPAWLLKALMGEMSTMLLEGQRVLPTKLSETHFSFQYPTLKDALQQIYT